MIAGMYINANTFQKPKCGEGEIHCKNTPRLFNLDLGCPNSVTVILTLTHPTSGQHPLKCTFIRLHHNIARRPVY